MVAVGRNGASINRTIVSAHLGGGLSAVRVPQKQRAIAPTGGDGTAIEREGAGKDPVLMSLHYGDGLTIVGAPQSQCVVFSGGCDTAAVRGESARQDHAVMPCYYGDGLGDVLAPQSQRAVPSGGCDAAAVWGEDTAKDYVFMPLHYADKLGAVGAPQSYCVVVSGRCDVITVRGEGAGIDRAFMPCHHGDGFGAVGAPEAQRAVLSGGGDEVTVRREGTRPDPALMPCHHGDGLGAVGEPEAQRAVDSGGSGEATQPVGDSQHQKPRRTGVLAGLGAIGVLLMKFKFAIVFLLTKGKLLLLGLTKASTFFSMLLSLGVYWTLWGWKFALGFVLSIYIHEMGHVAMLRRFGIRASAPMFIPGFGAVVLLREKLTSPIEDARVGLAGPFWGLGAATASWGLSIAFHSPMFAAIAKTGAWINLFNLMPVWQLDGSRAFRALSRVQRGIAAVMLLATLFATSEHLLLLVLVVAAVRIFAKDADPQGDWRTLADYAFLTAALSALTLV